MKPVNLHLNQHNNLNNALICQTTNQLDIKPQKRQIIAVPSTNEDNLDYFLYRPSHVKLENKILVSIHGYTRNAAEHAFKLKPIAEKLGVCLVVPHFTKERFPKYQTLQKDKEGFCPNIIFKNTLNQAIESLSIKEPELCIFGYSGGAQFIHRNMLVRQQNYKKVALMAPGWFTWPTLDYAYPIGLQSSGQNDVKYNYVNYSETAVKLYVGNKDTIKNRSLNQDPIIKKLQGKNRKQRAENWIQAMSKCQWPNKNISFELIHDVDHNFSKTFNDPDLVLPIFEWLLNSK